MLLAMQKAKKIGIGIMSHAEFDEINKYDTRLSENLMTSRDIELARYTDCHLHMAHVSTKEAMEEIILAKQRHINVTCEVTPHHIGLVNSNYRVNPPIRCEEDALFLIHAIKQGWVDAIGTDHAPHTAEDKRNGSPGLSGIETAFSVCYTKLVKENGTTLNRLSEIMSKRPGELLGLNKGQIRIGFDGDIVLVDLNKNYKVNSLEFASKGKNTPFDGMELFGIVEATIKGGKIVYKREEN
jgi:dihydroorotase